MFMDAETCEGRKRGIAQACNDSVDLVGQTGIRNLICKSQCESVHNLTNHEADSSMYLSTL